MVTIPASTGSRRKARVAMARSPGRVGQHGTVGHAQLGCLGLEQLPETRHASSGGLGQRDSGIVAGAQQHGVE
jgi:hypothetical protein